MCAKRETSNVTVTILLVLVLVLVFGFSNRFEDEDENEDESGATTIMPAGYLIIKIAIHSDLCCNL